jgi:hypothetical protein
MDGADENRNDASSMIISIARHALSGRSPEIGVAVLSDRQDRARKRLISASPLLDM